MTVGARLNRLFTFSVLLALLSPFSFAEQPVKFDA